MNYIPGSDAIFALATEGAYPSADTFTVDSVPGSPTYAGPSTIPEITEDEGSKSDGGLGSLEDFYDVPGGRMYDGSVDVRVALPANLINYAQPTAQGGAVGHLGMPDFCVWYGASSANVAGYGRRLRHCVTSQLDLNFSNESAKEVVASWKFRGLFPEAEDLLNPSISALQAIGPPLTWHNVASINVHDGGAGTYNFRPYVTAFNLSNQFTLVNEPFRPDTGDNDVLSRTLYGIKCTGAKRTLSMTLESPGIAAALTNATSTATKWGTIVLTAGNGTRTLVVTINAARIKTRRQRGGDRTSQMGSTVDVVVRNVVLSGG